jgi:signal transduction histidine kinase
LPWARIYLNTDDRQRAVVAATCGAGPLTSDLGETIPLITGPLADVMKTSRAHVFDLAPGGSGHEIGTAPPAPGSVLALPITRQGVEHPMGILIAATSPRLMLDDAYRDFLSLVASQIGTAVAGAQAFEEAQARAEALAQLDRAKTAFFNNVSHEFRTPLTLMLGPTEEALAAPDRTLRGADLETVHRNELRLLKLVNTLLDFSRIEAGRVNATFEPTDLAALTTDLASAFRSAIERAGLQLIVDCPPLPVPVHVDREMWEKIVLNLLSNALKFTFEGAITVRQSGDDAQVELRVRDTGIGIAPSDLARVFDRFHRIERAAARTHEGSGIGLALVRELVGIHGGTILASSAVGEGSEFCVRVPVGVAHRTAEHGVPGNPRGEMQPALAATAYVEEALRWLPPDGSDDMRDTPPPRRPQRSRRESRGRRQRRHARLSAAPPVGAIPG